MQHTGKFLIIAGLALAAIGALLWLLSRTGFRGLPGDVRYESENVRFYFPIATSIALSIALTFLMWLWQWFSRR